MTGLLTILISLAVVVWAAFVRNRNGGRVLILLPVIMLLVGGGFGAPTIGVLAGVAGTGIGTPSTRWRERLSANVRRFLATLWSWIFGIGVINGVFLVIGSVILVYFFDLNNPDLFTNSFFFSILSVLLTIFVGRVYDIQTSEQSMAT